MYLLSLHQQTGLSAGTVANNHQLATDLGHGVGFGGFRGIGEIDKAAGESEMEAEAVSEMGQG